MEREPFFFFSLDNNYIPTSETRILTASILPAGIATTDRWKRSAWSLWFGVGFGGDLIV